MPSDLGKTDCACMSVSYDCFLNDKGDFRMRIQKSKKQKGNVLFLILIAVALFAALSYAVTQSSRSSGDASKETTGVSVASLTQYPNSLRTAVLRMVISGTDPLNIQFNSPSNFTGTAFNSAAALFHPSGGGAVYQQIKGNLTPANGADIPWVFSAGFEVPLIGTSASSSSAGNEIIAFASGITQAICQRLNTDLYNATIATAAPPVSAAAWTFTDRVTSGATPLAAITGETVMAGAAPNAAWFDGKAYGCFQNTAAGAYVFYYVLAER
jgi:hypothetical protein